jgi:hypothetical protein
MPRLIDADLLVEEIEKRARAPRGTMEILRDILSVIDGQPTAYDVDAVVERLRQQANQYHNRAELYSEKGVCNEWAHMSGKAASYEHAIEIVKRGGIND